ncbi:uncharacterized protein LOC122293436 isoform X2 [Carya illinoinensis]|uniref:uncharacterized protein LOC122293436 isoform X2 n=2 Tax=Carya illinoinensis TaxID=32201 RepID=UPI001C725954|nr:uncharacterized protein LOC122293436 isoform X2 [Carya illinoinensis]
MGTFGTLLLSKAPYKNGKSGVQRVLHDAELQACIVPNDPTGKKQYMLRSIADPNYTVCFLDRTLVREEASSQSGKCTFLNCFDMGSGSRACAVKEGVRLYFNIRAAHVEKVRHSAIESTLVDALSQGMSAKDAAKQAQKEGAKVAKLVTRHCLAHMLVVSLKSKDLQRLAILWEVNWAVGLEVG